MLDGILIAPENRFLTLSTYDFSLYGGQMPPALNFSAARPPDDTPAPSTDLADAGEAAPAAAIDPMPIDSPAATSSAAPELSFPTFAAPTLASVQPPNVSSADPAIAPAAAAPFDVAPLVPQPTGSGSIAPAQTQQTQSPLPDVGPLSQPLHEAGVGSLVSNLAVSNLAAAVTDTLTSSSLSALPAAVADTVGQTGHTIDTVVAPLTDTLDSATDTSAGLINGAASVVTPLADALVGAVTDTHASGAEDDLTGLAGSDPVGGVATLVSLVSVSDVFDVGEGEAHDSITTLAPDLVDTLAADALPESPLLGDHDASDDAGLLHTPVDDPLGLI